MKSAPLKNTLILLVLLFLFSCAKEVNNNCSLTKISSNGALVTQFFLNNGKVSRIEQYNQATGFLSGYWLLVYDEIGRLDYADAYTGGASFIERNQIARNADGNIGRIYNFIDGNSDMIPEQLTGYLEYVYDGNQHITEEKHYSAPSTYIYSEFFTWSGNNLIRKENLALGSSVFTYDNKKSRFGNYKELYFLFYNPTYLSENNVINIDYFDTGNNPLGTVNFTLQYNSDGYPTQETSTIESYEYNCVSE